jgi:hypothetical protein
VIGRVSRPLHLPKGAPLRPRGRQDLLEELLAPDPRRARGRTRRPPDARHRPRALRAYGKLSREGMGLEAEPGLQKGNPPFDRRTEQRSATTPAMRSFSRMAATQGPLPGGSHAQGQRRPHIRAAKVVGIDVRWVLHGLRYAHARAARALVSARRLEPAS